MWFDYRSFECNINFELLGILLGLAIYNETILPLKFPLAVYKKLKKKGNQISVFDELSLDDLQEFEPELYTTLRNILYTDCDEIDMGVNFTVNYEIFGEVKTSELIPNGANITVNNSNKQYFVESYLNWYFNISV